MSVCKKLISLPLKPMFFKHLGTSIPWIEKALIEVPGVIMGSFVTLVIVVHSFCTMNGIKTQENLLILSVAWENSRNGSLTLKIWLNIVSRQKTSRISFDNMNVYILQEFISGKKKNTRYKNGNPCQNYKTLVTIRTQYQEKRSVRKLLSVLRFLTYYQRENLLTMGITCITRSQGVFHNYFNTWSSLAHISRLFPQ